jgi:hypothetical protein
MKKYLMKWKYIKTEVHKPELFKNSEAHKKEQLIELAALYKKKSNEFDQQELIIVNKFDLNDFDKKYLKFGIRKPVNKLLKKYYKALNSDQNLIRLSKEMQEILLTGNLLILKQIIKEGVEIGGYNLNAFVKRPSRYHSEIHNLILGAWGYEHIHVINDKIMYEIPARHYLNNEPDILSLIDNWINNLGIVERN